MDGPDNSSHNNLWYKVDNMFIQRNDFKKEWIQDSNDHREEINKWLDNLFNKPGTEKEKKLRELKEQYQALGEAINQLEEE